MPPPATERGELRWTSPLDAEFGGGSLDAMADQQQTILGIVWQLQQKIDDLASKLYQMERILKNIDANAAATTNMVSELSRRIR